MARYAVIDGGVVVNVVEADQEFAQSNGWVEAPTAAIGDLWDGEAFAPPPAAPPVVPAAVTMRQARLALLGAGLLGSVQTAIDGLPSPQREAAQIEWDYSNELQRDNAFVALLAPALGLTSEQLDALFITAAGL